MKSNPAGLVAVAAVVVAGMNLIFLWFNSTATRRHEIRILRETRVQNRLETTYREFVTLMHHAAANADLVVNGTPVPAADMLTSREVSEAVGQIKTFGSEAVIRQSDEWADIFGDLTSSLAQGNISLAASRLQNLRQQEQRVREAMRQELSP